jgi:DNA polymerase-3 subunit delta'
LIINFVRGFESIVDQEQSIQILSTFLRHGNIPHALLFAGTKGVGKRTTAVRFAMACNCEENLPGLPQRGCNIGPCGVCRSCRKIETGNHPDIIHVRPAGAFIKIAQIRELCDTLGLKPYEAKTRVVIISQADVMNPEAGNALLKILEEPPDQTVLILTAVQTSDLLPTIVSRCQPVRFKPISREHLEKMLTDKEGLDQNDAVILSSMANGSFSKAIEMNRMDWIRKRTWLIGEMESLSSRPVGLLLAFAEKLSANKEMLLDALDIISIWLRDLVICKRCPQKIINTDLDVQIQKSSKKHMTASLLSQFAAIQNARKDIQANANVRLRLEALILHLAQA